MKKKALPKEEAASVRREIRQPDSLHEGNMGVQLSLDQFAHPLPPRQNTITNSTKAAHNET